MRVSLVIVAVVALAITASAAHAFWTDWAYYYDGSYNPVNDGWSQGGGSEQPTWNQDDGTGVSALKIHHNSAQWTGNEPRYTKSGIPAHHALIYQMRFKLDGGAAAFASSNVYYHRVQYNDGRSRLMRVSDAGDGTGDDFFDPDMILDPLLAPFSTDWHTVTLLMVGVAAPGATNAGTQMYLDGVPCGSRSAGVASNSYSIIMGIVKANSGAWGGAEGDLWVDYVRWGFDDTPDENGVYGFVPEPSAFVALGAGLVGLAGAFRRRARL